MSVGITQLDQDALVQIVISAGDYSRGRAEKMVSTYLDPPELPTIEQVFYQAIVQRCAEAAIEREGG